MFGLGCDPDNQHAVEKILEIKQRSVEKGLILLAGDFNQFLPYIDLTAIPKDKFDLMLARWPNGITQVVPASSKTAKFVTGQFSSIAIRVTDQVDVVDLCQQTNKPIVSTSANISGQPPATTWQEVEQALTGLVDHIIKGQTLGYNKPSTIVDVLTGETFRS